MNQAFHNAVIDILTTGLSPVLVYSQVPQDAPRPYVLVADANGDAWDTSDSEGAKVTLEVTIISDYRGTLQALNLADQVDTILGHGESINLAGAASLVDLWTAPPSLDNLDDGRTTRATVRVSALLDDIAPTTA